MATRWFEERVNHWTRNTGLGLQADKNMLI